MKILLILLCLVFSFSSFAQSKAQMKQMLQQFKSKGMFTDEQLKAAEAQLDQMSDDDINKMKSQAMQKMNDPKIQSKLKEFQKQQ